MRNAVGGTIGALIGSFALVVLLGVAPPTYPSPFDAFSHLLGGGRLLLDSFTGFVNASTALPYLGAWLLLGVIAAVFSTKGWNTVRTLLWSALVAGLLALISEVLLNDFWGSPSRNLDLVLLFAQMAVFSMVALLSAYPVTVLKERALRETEAPIPERIETACECGAVFRSNPLICSECGRTLRMEPSDLE